MMLPGFVDAGISIHPAGWLFRIVRRLFFIRKKIRITFNNRANKPGLSSHPLRRCEPNDYFCYQKEQMPRQCAA